MGHGVVTSRTDLYGNPNYLHLSVNLFY